MMGRYQAYKISTDGKRVKLIQLPDEMIRRILQFYRNGRTAREIGAKYGLSEYAIRDVARRSRKWNV